MTYWNSEITESDISGPKDFMLSAADELSSKTGLLTASIQESKLEDRVVLGFTINNPKTRVSHKLFEVSHLPEQFYPARIHPPDDELPDFLQEFVYVPGRTTIAKTIREMEHGTPGKYVKNEWACFSPSQFENKLGELLSAGPITAKVLSLIAGDSSEPAATPIDPPPPR